MDFETISARGANLEPQVVGPFTLGNHKNCYLRETTDSAFRRYQNELMKPTKFGPTGMPVGTDGTAPAETLLLHLCLFEKYAGDDGRERERPFPLVVIAEWPSRVTDPLINKIKEMSGIVNEPEELNKEENLVKIIDRATKRLNEVRAAKKGETPEKNSQSATPASCG